jgi:hypothetical protein
LIFLDKVPAIIIYLALISFFHYSYSLGDLAALVFLFNLFDFPAWGIGPTRFLTKRERGATNAGYRTMPKEIQLYNFPL